MMFAFLVLFFVVTVKCGLKYMYIYNSLQLIQ